MTIEHILVRVPIVFPTLAIDKVAKMIFLVWFQCDRGCESAFFRRFIGMVFLFHSLKSPTTLTLAADPTASFGQEKVTLSRGQTDQEVQAVLANGMRDSQAWN